TRMGEQETNNLQIVEIPPGGQLKPEHHMYDAVMYVLSGRGASTIWQEGEPKAHVEWQEGSLLGIPLNAWHEEFNGSGTEPCRVVFGTNMAQAINHFHNLDFVFNSNYVFSDRYSALAPKFFGDEGTRWNLRLFETNFIPDIRSFELDPWPERGVQTQIMRLSMASTSLGIHILGISEGTYVTAHRHFAGAHVIQIQGTGYEMMFWPGDEHNAESRRTFSIKPYGVVAPQNYEFHQHFNTGKTPFRQLAFRGGGVRYGSGSNYDPVGAAISDTQFAFAYKLRHDLEDPAVREEYYAELEKNGIDLRLEPVDQGRS
ncbi:MAG: cupin domain-containing protein, partial [Dehalococcoidia bacterium]